MFRGLKTWSNLIKKNDINSIKNKSYMEIKSDLPLDDLSPNPNKSSTDSPCDSLSANPAPMSGVIGSMSLE
jgi:hypothetical protein